VILAITLAVLIVIAAIRLGYGEGDRMVTHLTGYVFGSGPLVRKAEDR
jgi:hypothetical protein